MPGKKLLVADDSLTIQKVIRLALSNEGYQIQTVSDGKDALQQISLFQPDVVLIDVSLPGQSAFEVKRELNQHEDLKHIPFILMSSVFEKVDEKQASEVFFQGRLSKPFDPAHLRETLLQFSSSSSPVSSKKTPSQPSSSPPKIPPHPSLISSSLEPETLLVPSTPQEQEDLWEPEEFNPLEETNLLPPSTQESLEEETGSPPSLDSLLLNEAELAALEKETTETLENVAPSSEKEFTPLSEATLSLDPFAASEGETDMRDLARSTLQLAQKTPPTDWSLHEPSLKLPNESSFFSSLPNPEEKQLPPLNPLQGIEWTPAIEKIIREEVLKLVPDVAEKMIRQEIHRMLSE